MGGAVGQYCHDLCRVCVFGGACVRPGQSVRRAACAAGGARRAVLLHPGRGFGQLQRQPHREKTLRAAIYEKLLRLGGSYTQAVPTAEVLQLAGEGVEQLETYFGAYLPQFFYAMLAPLTLFIALAPVSLRAAVI